MSRFDGRAALCIIAVALGALTACSSGTGANTSSAGSTSSTGGWAATVARAKSEGTAAIVTTETPAWQTATTAYVKAHSGINMQVAASGANGTLETRLNAEFQAGVVQTDVYEDIDLSYFNANASKFVNLSTLKMPNYASYPADDKYKNTCVYDKLSVGGLVYNTKLVTGANIPTSWQDLLKPYWKGKILMIDPNAGENYMFWGLLMLKNFGNSYLTQFAAQKPGLAESSVTAAEQVASGAYQASVLSFPDSSRALIDSGAPLKFVVLRNPDLGATACVGILKDSPHPAAAAVLLNDLMSAGAQSAACRAGGLVVSPIGAAGCDHVPSDWALSPKTASGAYPGINDTALTGQVLKDLGVK
jgi:iron(III) transport system substrate-binding protein